jgi:hypothetical protein
VSDAFRPWLPDNAGLTVSAQGALADAIDAWSIAWFVGEPVHALGRLVRVQETRNELRHTLWHRRGGDVAIGLPPAGLAGLGARVLGIGATARPSADVELLEKVGMACLDDLKARVSVLLGIARSERWSVSEAAEVDAGHRLDLGTSSRTPVLMLQLSDECFAHFLKSRLPGAVPVSLGDATGALAALPVNLWAALGSCGITVAELAGLAAGDILVLDRELDASLPLALAGVPLRRGACTIGEAGGALSFDITQAPVGIAA